MISGKQNEFSITKTLRLQWDKVNDTVIFNMKKLDNINSNKPIKKEFIQFFASICDNGGLINPTIVSFQCLFQKICISKVNQDAILPPGILNVWHNIILHLRSFNRLVFSWWYGNLGSAKGVDLCRISVPTVVAFRITGQDGLIHSSLVTSMWRVSHILQVSVPKLELQGSTLLAHVIKPVHSELSSFIHISSI